MHHVSVTDPMKLWDFNDPAGSERRFREAAAATAGDDRAAYLTQVARALGLQEKYDEGHQVLDGLAGVRRRRARSTSRSSAAGCCARRATRPRPGRTSPRPSGWPRRPAATTCASTRCT